MVVPQEHSCRLFFNLKKVNLAKPNTKVTTPITAAIKALKKLNINKISIFTPYTNE